METKNIAINPRKKQFKVGFTWGVICGIALIVFTLLLYMFDVLLNQWASLMLYAVQAFVIFFGIKTYRDHELGGFISFGKSFGVGAIIAGVSSLIMSVFTYIMYEIIDPDIVKGILEMTESAMLKQGYSYEIVEKAMEVQRNFINATFMSIIAIPAYTFWGSVLSLIISIFTQKKQTI